MNVKVTMITQGNAVTKGGEIVEVTISERNLRELSNMWTAVEDGCELQPTLLRVVETGEFLSITVESDDKHYGGR